MSKWTHAICLACWIKKNPGRVPIRLRDVPRDVCCYCGEEAWDGIYVRDDPADLPCQGHHKDDMDGNE